LWIQFQSGCLKNTSAAYSLELVTAKRLRLKAQGCRSGYPGTELIYRFNRKAVASKRRNPFRVDHDLHLFPRVEATLGSEALPLCGNGAKLDS
jgi:hypothetical protein